MIGGEEDRQQVNRIEQRETAYQFKGKKRKPDLVVVTARVIFVVTVVVRQETQSARGVTR